MEINIPEHAREEIDSWWENGQKRSANYFVDGQLVWQRAWEESGQLSMERGMQNNIAHGPQRYWHDNGQLSHESFNVEGKEHGISRQYDEEGNLIGTYAMNHGTGLDRWYQKAGVLVEERQYRDGAKHGFERWHWWYREPCEDGTIWSEGYFKAGEKHGIFREWNVTGGISRGFPQYFVNGEQLPKRRYLTACKRDSSLPPYCTEDNTFHREPLVG